MSLPNVHSILKVRADFNFSYVPLENPMDAKAMALLKDVPEKYKSATKVMLKRILSHEAYGKP